MGSAIGRPVRAGFKGLRRTQDGGLGCGLSRRLLRNVTARRGFRLGGIGGNGLLCRDGLHGWTGFRGRRRFLGGRRFSLGRFSRHRRLRLGKGAIRRKPG